MLYKHNGKNIYIFHTDRNILKNLSNHKSEISQEYIDTIYDIITLNNINDFINIDKDNNDFITINELYRQYINDRSIFAYVDENNNILENFLPFDKDELFHLVKHNISPYMANAICLWSDGNTSSTPTLKILLGNMRHDFGKRHYRVGIMSDIHYNDSNVDKDPETISNIDGSEYDNDLRNALSFYQDKEDVEFICASGDITTDSKSHMMNFKLAMDKYAPTTPLYSCLGNHDNQTVNWDQNTYNTGDWGYDGYKSRIQAWNELITPNDPTIHYYDEFSDKGKLSYWFEREIGKTGKTDIYVMLSLDYGVSGSEIENSGGWQIQAAQHMLDYDDPNVEQLLNYIDENKYTRNDIQKQYDYQFYDSGVLVWLKDLLESYPNKRFFIFTHLFFNQKAGTNNSEVKYGYSYDYWRIQGKDEQHLAYCLCGLQFDFLNKLNNEYTNTIWFSGHSHYRWNWQTIDPTINICNVDYYIYDPKNQDFNQDKRYLRKYDHISLPPMKEKYYDHAIYDNQEVLTLTLEKNNELPSGQYKLSIIAIAAYTPNRGIIVNAPNKEYGYDSLFINDNEINLPVVYNTSFMWNEISRDNIYNVIIDVNDDTNLINIKLKSTQYGGANWFILGLQSFINIESNEDYTYLYQNTNIYDENGNIANTPGSQYIPRTAVDDTKNYISNDQTGYNIHIPSTSRPLKINNEYSDCLDLTSSEGAIMDVYENYIDIRAIIFKDTNIPLGYTYKSFNKTVIEIDYTRDYDANQAILDSYNQYNIVLKFSKPKQRVLIDFKAIDPCATNYIEVYDAIVMDGNGTNITSQLKSQSEPYIGLFGTDRKYHLDSCEVNILNGKLDLPCSSQLTNVTYPLRLYMNAKIKVTNYLNKYYPLGQYRINLKAN